LIVVARLATMDAMNRKPLMGALLIAAASMLATGAYAQNNNASPQGKAAAADKGGDKGGDKGAEKKADNAAKTGDDKAGDNKAGKPGDKADDKGKPGEDRGAKKAKEHEALKAELKNKLKGPPDEALKQELRRHAERLAKLERIKAVADTEKDKASSDKATSLIAKEDARHDKWMEKHVSGSMPAAGSAATPAAAPATSGGSK
jgi:hypothetical protein